jgi:hypothetical protein
MDEQGGEVRRLERAPGERYRGTDGPGAPKQGSGAGPSRRRRITAALAVALGTAVVTFVLTTYDVGPGLLVIGIAGGWLTGLALAGGAGMGAGPNAGPMRAVAAGAMAAGGLALGLLADSLRAHALGGVLLPWEYLLALFGPVAPLSIILAALAGAIRGR